MPLKSLCITVLVNYPSRHVPTDSADEAHFRMTTFVILDSGIYALGVALCFIFIRYSNRSSSGPMVKSLTS